LLGLNFEILHFNRAIADFIKQTSGKNIKNGKNLLHFINAGYKPTFINDFKLAQSGKSINREILVGYDNQTSIWWNILLDPVKNDEGEIFSVSLNATNINEKKQHLAEITAQNESLLKIAYIQSHEYRRPVASIIGLMNVIKQYDYEFDKDCLTMMENAVNELDEKINGVVQSVQSTIPNQAS
jgi:signal transduction histidine kinase